MSMIRTEQEFQKVINGSLPAVIVFKASWCPDCHFIEPFMPDLELLYQDRLNLVYLDRDDLPDLCSDLNILGIPSFIVFRKGQEITRFVSKLRKTKEEIQQFLERSIELADELDKLT